LLQELQIPHVGLCRDGLRSIPGFVNTKVDMCRRCQLLGLYSASVADECHGVWSVGGMILAGGNQRSRENDLLCHQTDRNKSQGMATSSFRPSVLRVALVYK
jgi:hypothetical protein